MCILTLTTDFGTRDYYLGAVKGVILSIATDLHLVDLSHHIPPRDILAGAYVLRHAAAEFPPGTVHLAVVDPGVGGGRRPLALASGGHLWVGPDNGLLSFALEAADCQAREITHARLRRPRLSPSFHGRDLFAPAAAHLAAGFPFEQVGPTASEPLCLEQILPRREGERLVGEIIHVDRFGNLVSNIAAAELRDWPRLRIALPTGQVLERLSRTYAEVEAGAVLALIGSTDLLEISINGGHAARALGLERGARIVAESY